MGGNALKNCKTRRYDADEYFAIAEEVSTKLRTLFVRVEVVQAYAEKDTFGDLDIICQYNGSAKDGTAGDPRFVETFQKMFGSKEIVPNGKVYSLEYKEFQIDVILTPTEEFEFARHYYAYNDLGNLMGRIAHKFGLKYGHDGLYYMMRDGTHLIGEILVSRDVQAVFKFLDMDYEVWSRGFRNLEEIFDFVAESYYFNPDIYNFDQMNHRSRVRDQKRSTYNAFLTWCEQYKELYPEKDHFHYTKSKDYYLVWLFSRFPGFKEQWMALYQDMLVQREIKNKFNGQLVSGWTGLEGKELGTFIQDFKNNYPFYGDFKVWVVTTPVEEIESAVKYHFVSFNVVKRMKALKNKEEK